MAQAAAAGDQVAVESPRTTPAPAFAPRASAAPAVAPELEWVMSAKPGDPEPQPFIGSQVIGSPAEAPVIEKPQPRIPELDAILRALDMLRAAEAQEAPRLVLIPGGKTWRSAS